MTISSKITINDGTTSVNVNGYATLSIDIDESDAGGSAELRMGNGSITPQVRWEKKTVSISCSGWSSPKTSVDWGSLIWKSQQMTVTVPDEGGTKQYVGYCAEPQIIESLGQQINVRWTLVINEG